MSWVIVVIVIVFAAVGGVKGYLAKGNTSLRGLEGPYPGSSDIAQNMAHHDGPLSNRLNPSPYNKSPTLPLLLSGSGWKNLSKEGETTMNRCDITLRYDVEEKK